MTTQAAAPIHAGRVTRAPRILGGEPMVAGTRTSVRSIVLAARGQGTVAGVLDWYPHLTAEDVAGVLAFYQRHQHEVDGYVVANRDAAP